MVKLRNSASKVQSVDQRMRLGMRCRLSPTADVPSHTSGAAMGPLREIHWPLDRGRLRNWLSGIQLIEQRLRFLQIECIEALGEPAVHRREKVAGFGALALVAPQLRQQGRRT